MISENAEVSQIHVHLLGEMERILSTLAARWRSRQDTPEAEAIAHQYQAILRCMVELGYHDSLDVDAELPDEYMPIEYVKLFNATTGYNLDELLSDVTPENRHDEMDFGKPMGKEVW